MSVQNEIDGVIANPATSTWLRDALTTALGRDPVNAVNDAEYLSELLARFCDERLRADTHG